MSGFFLYNLNNIVQIAVLLYLSYRNLRNLQQKGPWVPAVLFMFILVTLLATGFYWVTHELMTGTSLYAFSAMDIGEIGIFLLLSALLGASFKEPLSRDLPALAAALFFAAGNALLWGAWNGHWAQDIASGLFLWVLVYTLIRGLKRTGSLSRPVWSAFGIGSAGIFALQTVAFLTEGTYRKIFDFASEVIWFAGIAYLMLRVIRILREDLPDEGLIGLACAASTWIVCTMYMSSNPYYIIADLCNTITFVLLLLVLERKWGETV
jgi:hypothetical protein